MSRPFAVFDIDGTLIRWQLYHAVADKLAKQGALDAADFARVRASRMNWKKRAAEESFDAYERQLVTLINGAISGLSVRELEQAYEEVITEYRDQVYTYTRDLIETLRRQNYWLFVISGSQSEIVKLLAEHYQFDDFGGTIYEQQDGRFTGKSRPLRAERKPEYLKQLVQKHGATWQGSIGVGDSESDIPMLALVEQPIAFNPTKKLFQHAHEQGWKIVLERKNMVYELEPKNGSYVLAQTNA
ncbi:MAG TPA: HAD family phosphatase [Candidatus Saccharimonadales bacterium]|nr:HAD family phosphatase [Candidatus Saccharimonadales bacterium]